MQIECVCSAAGIEVSYHHSHTLFSPEDLIEKNGGKPPHSMSAFQKLMDSMGEVPATAPDPPKQFPGLPQGAKSQATDVPTLKDLKYVESQSPYRVISTQHLLYIARKLALSTSLSCLTMIATASSIRVRVMQLLII